MGLMVKGSEHFCLRSNKNGKQKTRLRLLSASGDNLNLHKLPIRRRLIWKDLMVIVFSSEEIENYKESLVEGGFSFLCCQITDESL